MNIGNLNHYSNKPWECPRCQKINAPWMPQCNCNSQKEDAKKENAKMYEELNRLKNLLQPAEPDCVHLWDHLGNCKRCFRTKCNDWL